MKFFWNIFHEKSFIRTGKIESAFFYCRLWVRVELTRACGKNTSNTGSKGYVWLLVRRIQHFAWKTHAFGWSSVSDAFCNRLSYIEHTNLRANTQYLRLKDIMLHIRREFQWSKIEGKSDRLYKTFDRNLSWILTNYQLHDKSQGDQVRRRKTQRFGTVKKFWTFSTVLENRKPGVDSNRVHTPSNSYLQIGKLVLLHRSCLRDNYFQKKLPFSHREINGQSLLRVSTMTGLIAFFLLSTR